MNKRFELIIYTAAEIDYADTVLDYIEKKTNALFSYRLYSSQCLRFVGVCMFKYLDLLCNGRDLKDIMIVDNTVRNYALSIRNGVPIKTYKGEDNDNELVYLAKYMRMLEGEDDVMVRIKEDFATYLHEHHHSS